MRRVRRGRFISFEGGEGTGKSTQLRLLAERLRAQGLAVETTREPGGSPGAEELRRLLLNGAADRWSPLAEALLMNAARTDHLERTIRPALARGDWVLCDRFADSTRAYQGAAGGVDDAFLRALERQVTKGAKPDLTLMLDAPAALGLARAAARAGGEARFESKGLAFHEALRAAFRRIAAEESGRCVLIDAAAPVEAVAAQVEEAVRARLLQPA